MKDDEKTYTPEEIARLDKEAVRFSAVLEADAKRALLAVKTVHPQALCTIVVRIDGGHSVVVTEDDIGEVVAAIYKSYALTKN